MHVRERERERMREMPHRDSVTLKRIGFFCFPIKHSTHTRLSDLNLISYPIPYTRNPKL